MGNFDFDFAKIVGLALAEISCMVSTRFLKPVGSLMYLACFFPGFD